MYFSGFEHSNARFCIIIIIIIIIIIMTIITIVTIIIIITELYQSSYQKIKHFA